MLTLMTAREAHHLAGIHYKRKVEAQLKLIMGTALELIPEAVSRGEYRLKLTFKEVLTHEAMEYAASELSHLGYRAHFNAADPHTFVIEWLSVFWDNEEKRLCEF